MAVSGVGQQGQSLLSGKATVRARGPRPRRSAQAAGGDLEELIEAMRRSGANWQGFERYDLEQSSSRH